MNAPEYRSVADFVSKSGPCDFILDGQRGEKTSQLCRLPKAGPGAAVLSSSAMGSERLLECTQIALEGKCLAATRAAAAPLLIWHLRPFSFYYVAKDLFAAMQSLNFFCQLPQVSKERDWVRGPRVGGRMCRCCCCCCGERSTVSFAQKSRLNR